MKKRKSRETKATIIILLLAIFCLFFSCKNAWMTAILPGPDKESEETTPDPKTPELKTPDTKDGTPKPKDKTDGTFEFMYDSPLIKTYGDTAFTNVILPGYKGNGAITYFCSDEETAAVDENTGEVEILKAGEVEIWAKKAADKDYKEEKTSYTLVIKKAQLTLKATRTTFTGLTGENTANLSIGGFVNEETPACSMGTPSLPAGFTISGTTFTYNGTTAFLYPYSFVSAAVTTSDPNYSGGDLTLSIIVYDGQSDFTGASGTYDRRIPVTKTNITIFNSYANTTTGLTRHYKLMEDITLPKPPAGSYNWTSIGSSTPYFTGSFDCQNKKITGITCQGGMFYFSYGIIKNLGLEDININTNSDNVGGVVGVNYGNVQKCYVTGSVSGHNYVGGVVGNSPGTIENCYSTGIVSGFSYVGGVVGRNSANGSIENCHSAANVTSSLDYVGGVVAWNEGTVAKCYATGSVSSIEYDVGGVVGINYGNVQNCYAIGNISGRQEVGGVVGYNVGNVQNCYSTGNISGILRNVGGIVGLNGLTVQNCYATGNISGGDSVGGITGFHSVNNILPSKIQNCVALNPSVKGNSGSSIGRVVGSNNSTLSNNYSRNMTITANGSPVTVNNNLNDKHGYAITTYNSKSFWTLATSWNSSSLWDFEKVWDWNSTTNLPILRNVGGAQNPKVQ